MYGSFIDYPTCYLPETPDYNNGKGSATFTDPSGKKHEK